VLEKQHDHALKAVWSLQRSVGSGAGAAAQRALEDGDEDEGRERGRGGCGEVM